VAIAVWLAAGHPSLVAAKETFPLETCLWLGPVEINLRPDLNYGFPDTHAVYWQSRITLPAGARLDLVSQYAMDATSRSTHTTLRTVRRRMPSTT